MEIKYTEGARFKYTLTATDDIRVKIPETMKNSEQATNWLSICQRLTYHLTKIEREHTLRTKNVNSNSIRLQAGNRLFKYNIELDELTEKQK